LRNMAQHKDITDASNYSIICPVTSDAAIGLVEKY